MKKLEQIRQESKEIKAKPIRLTCGRSTLTTTQFIISHFVEILFNFIDHPNV